MLHDGGSHGCEPANIRAKNCRLGQGIVSTCYNWSHAELHCQPSAAGAGAGVGANKARAGCGFACGRDQLACCCRCWRLNYTKANNGDQRSAVKSTMPATRANCRLVSHQTNESRRATASHLSEPANNRYNTTTNRAPADCSNGSQSTQATMALLLIVVTLTMAQVGGCLAATVGGHSSSSSSSSLALEATTFVDSGCKWPESRPSDKLLVGFLLVLKCDIKPIYEQYRQFAAAAGSKGDPTGGEPAEMRSELQQVVDKIDEFARDGLAILEMKEFCTYSTILPLKRLKQLADGSSLLQLAYDLISIEFHQYCLAETIGRLPPVPYLIRDVVKIYVDGADRQLPDLNGDPGRLDDELGDDADPAGGPFDVERALAKNGSLRDVMGLLLMMPRQGVDEVQEFKRTCKLYLIDIEQHWQSMEMMSAMLATEGNGIKRMNNYIMRKLTPTKYADICSQLSARDSRTSG